jgi:hypothetical protein
VEREIGGRRETASWAISHPKSLPLQFAFFIAVHQSPSMEADGLHTTRQPVKVGTTQARNHVELDSVMGFGFGAGERQNAYLGRQRRWVVAGGSRQVPPGAARVRGTLQEAAPAGLLTPPCLRLRPCVGPASLRICHDRMRTPPPPVKPHPSANASCVQRAPSKASNPSRLGGHWALTATRRAPRCTPRRRRWRRVPPAPPPVRADWRPPPPHAETFWCHLLRCARLPLAW